MRRRGLVRIVAVGTILPLGLAGVTLLAAPVARASGGTSLYASLPIAVGSHPTGVAVDQATDTVYATNACGTDPSCNSAGTVSVINGATNSVAATIGVGFYPTGVAVDAATDTVYVTNVESDSVSVINGATDTVTATIAVGTGPDAVAVDAATDTIWVTNSGSDSVSVIYGVTNTVLEAIAVGSSPDAVAVDATTVWVTNSLSDSVSAIDMFGLGGIVGATIYGVGADPTGVAVDGVTNTAYVTAYSSGSVAVIAGSPVDQVVGSIAVGAEPYGVAVDGATDTVYVSSPSGTVSVIEGGADTVTDAVDAGSEAPYGVAVDASTGAIYTADPYSNTVTVMNHAPILGFALSSTIADGPDPPPGEAAGGVAVDADTDTVYTSIYVTDSVAVINAATNTLTATIPIGSVPYGVAVDDATDTLYVPNSANTVSVINGTTNTVTATIAIGGTFPMAVAVDEATDRVYIANYNENTVSVIDGSTDNVTATVGVGAGPNAVAVDAATDTVYVTNLWDGTVSVINGGNDTVITTVHIGSDPNAVAVNEATDTVYAVDEGSDAVSVVDGATNMVTATVTVGSAPEGVGVDAATDIVYAVNNASVTVSVIDGATDKVIATVSGGDYISGVAADDNTDTAYVFDAGSSDRYSPAPPAVQVISTTFATLSGSPTISTATAGDGQASVAFSAPADDGGVPIGSYTVAATDLTHPTGAGQTVSGTTSPITVTGLTDGDSYTFTVTANSFAPGAPSASSNAVTPHVTLAISSVSPSQVLRGAKATVVVSGAGFVAPVTVTVSGKKVTPTVLSVTATTVTLRVGVATQATLGARDLTVSDIHGTVTCTGCLTITSAPSLTSATPPAIAVGASGTVTFDGSGFETGATIKFSGPSTNVTAKASSIVVTATTLNVRVTVHAGAALGAYTVKITNPDHSTATCTTCFAVIAAPTLASIAPPSAAPGTTTSVTLTGSGYTSGATVKGPSGVTFTNVIVVNSTTITATMKIAATAHAGNSLAVTVANNAAGGYGKATGNILTVT